jgi:hypothetical protein
MNQIGVFLVIDLCHSIFLISKVLNRSVSPPIISRLASNSKPEPIEGLYRPISEVPWLNQANTTNAIRTPARQDSGRLRIFALSIT